MKFQEVLNHSLPARVALLLRDWSRLAEAVDADEVLVSDLDRLFAAVEQFRADGMGFVSALFVAILTSSTQCLRGVAAHSKDGSCSPPGCELSETFASKAL